MRSKAPLAGLAIALAFVTLGLPNPASASEIRQPTGNPFVVAGGPSTFTVVASGFVPNANVFVEQCDGIPASTTGWSPTIDCDLGSSPPPASADANGVATFDANKAFQPFEGESPQGLFNCLAAGQPAPANQLHSFTNCQVRVSSNNSSATADQTFFAITLPPPGTPPPRGSVTTTTTTTSGPTTTIPGPKKPVPKKPGAKAPGTKSTTTSVAHSKPDGAKGAAGSGRAEAAAAARAAGTHHGDSRTFTGAGALIGYAFIVGGLGLALGARLVRRRRVGVGPSGPGLPS